MAAAKQRVNLNHLMYVRYKHRDRAMVNKFAVDFGFIPVKDNPSIAWYRGFGEDPVSYISEKSQDGTSLLYGGGWAVDDYDDLELAATVPGASPIIDLGDEDPIGGKVVELKDPAGTSISVHWGYKERSKEEVEKPKKLVFNSWDEKRRLGEFQRLPDGPSHIHKLGHYGVEVSFADFEAVRKWYFETFTLAATDSLYDPKTEKDVMTFIHLDKGEQYVDHHSFFVSAGDVKNGYDPHHSSFEVDDFDSELKGHAWLEKKGWSLVWGVGRHILGSQIFDYWFDPDGFVVEHYADGDLVNCHHIPERVPATPESISVWGPDVPLSFLTRKIEDRGKVAGPPPVVVA